MEIRFWRLIDPLRRAGFHFRKQVGMGPYVVDFACHRAKLVVEIDGDTHFSVGGDAADKARDAAFMARGYRVLRFTNHEVLDNPEGVYLTVLHALGDTPSLPSPQGGV